jgi:hypothetical protein
MPVNPKLSTYNDLFNADPGNRLKVSETNKIRTAPGKPTEEFDYPKRLPNTQRRYRQPVERAIVQFNDPFRNPRSEELTTETISV